MAEEETTVVEGAFTAVHTQDQKLADVCQAAMVKAIQDCLDQGFVAPEVHQRAMMDAYRRAKADYYGTT